MRKKETDLHILLVEDESGHIELIRRALEGIPGKFIVTVASTIKEAQQLVAKQSPDLALVDYRLPDGQGDLIIALGKDSFPVIILTSHGDEQLAVQSIKAGAFDYVAKSPESFETLPHIVDRALREWQLIQDGKEAQLIVAKLRQAIETSGEAIFLTDREGIFTYINPGFTTLYGYASDELIGKETPRILKSNLLTAEVYQHFWKTISSGKEVKGEILNRRKDGSLIEIDGSASPIVDNDKNIIGYLGIQRNISERKQAEKALMLTRLSIESASDALFWITPNGNIVDVNDAACRSLGYSREELLQLSVPKIDAYYNAEIWKQHFLELREQGTLKFETVQRTKDGRLIPVEIVANYIRKGDEEFNCAFARDITERKRAEEALRESETRYRELIETMPDGVYKSSHEGKFLEINPAMVKILGYDSKEELLAIDIKTQLYFEEEDRDSAALEEALKEMAVFRLKKKDGSEVWVEDNGRHVLDDEGSILYHEGILRDITERKKTEDSLRASEETFRRLFKESADPILILNDNGFIDCNQSTVALLGYQSKDEFLNKQPWEISPERQPDGMLSVEKAKQMLATAIQQGYNRFEWIHTKSDGTLFPVEVMLTPIVIKGENNFYTVWRDITERKKAEEALRQAQKMESIGTLAGGIAHDFNNLLVGILGQASLALKKLPKENPAVSNIMKSISASERAADLVRQLLAYSGKGKFFTVEIDLNTLVKENIQMLEVSIPKTAHLHYDLGSPSPHIIGDIGQFQQVIMNLIINAGESMGPNPGYINIRTNRIELTENNTEYSKYTNTPLAAGSYALLQVKDTGSGISQETLSRIFDPFFTTKFTGRGLGLAAVLGIIKGHKGGLRIESEEGNGTLFEIVLPLVTTSALADVSEEKKDSAIEGEGKTILIIDDDPFVFQLLEDILTEAHFKVIGAADPLKGIELYRKDHQNISMIILDFSMPTMNGKDTFERLLQINKDVKVLLCSGYTEEETLSSFGKERPTGFFQKPYNSDALVEWVVEILSDRRTIQ